MRAMTTWQFDRCGDHLALDFANTVSERETAAPIERLQDYEALVAFAEQCGLVAAARARRLRKLARQRPEAAAVALNRAVALRDAVYALFRAIARGEAAAEEDLDTLNAEVPRLRLGADLSLGWRDGENDLDGFLGAVVTAALTLATDAAVRSRVHLCEAPDCEWLFYDGSKNRSRRWCDMRQCGNRMKARRHHARGRGDGAG